MFSFSLQFVAMRGFGRANYEIFHERQTDIHTYRQRHRENNRHREKYTDSDRDIERERATWREKERERDSQRETEICFFTWGVFDACYR